MGKIEDVEFKVAIGFGGGGCVVEIIEACEETKTDINEYGSYLVELFHKGTELPIKEGIYTFKGETFGCHGGDEMFTYKGVFTLLDLSKL